MVKMITTDDAKVEAAEQQQQQQQTQQDQIDLSKELSDRIIDAASTGGKDGFEIKMGRKTGNKIFDPLDGKETDEVVFDTSKIYHRHSISTQDYKRYNQAKEQLANETDENKRNDLAMRMYEYLAMKFLGMSHEEFVKADFDDVVVAALACDAMFGMGNSPQQQTQQTQHKTERRLPNPRMTLSASGSKQPRNYYQAPDEE